MKQEGVEYSGKDKDGTEFSGSVSYNFPESIQEAIEKWGEDVVLSKAVASVTIDLQRVCRTAGGNGEEAQKLVDAFIPGVTRPRIAGGVSMKAIKEKLKTMSADDKKALLEALGLT